jgi:hypothetical protein
MNVAETKRLNALESENGKLKNVLPEAHPVIDGL